MALQISIKKLSKGETHKCVDNIYNNSSNGTNTEELLDTLYQKNTVNDIRTIYNSFFDIYSVENITIGEDCLGKKSLDELVFDLPNTTTVVSAVAGPSQMTLCTAKIDTQQGTLSAIMPLVIYSSRPMLLSIIGEPDGVWESYMSPNSSGEKTGDYNLSQRWLDPRATISRSMRSLRGPMLNHLNHTRYVSKIISLVIALY